MAAGAHRPSGGSSNSGSSIDLVLGRHSREQRGCPCACTVCKPFPEQLDRPSFEKALLLWKGRVEDRFLSHVKVSDDTLDEVPDLFSQSSTRIPMALVTVAFILSNFVVIIATSTFVLTSYEVMVPLSAAQDSFVSYLIFSLIKISDPEKGRMAMDPRVMVAVVELSILFVYTLRCFRLVLISFCHRVEMGRFHASANFYWVVLDQMSAISSMKLLYFVTPSILSKELVIVVGAGKSTCETAWNVTMFASLRLTCLILGADAFFVKLGELSGQSHESLRDLILLRLFFLRQCLGIFQMRFFLQKRLFIFVFGGEDGAIDDLDSMKMEVWRSMLAKKIWDSYAWKDSWPGIKYWSMMLTYNDYDFQRLILDDPEHMSERHSDSPRRDKPSSAVVPQPWPTLAAVPAGAPAAFGPWPAAGGVACAPLEVQRLQERLQQSELRAAEARVGELCAKMELHQLRSAARGEAFAREARELR